MEEGVVLNVGSGPQIYRKRREIWIQISKEDAPVIVRQIDGLTPSITPNCGMGCSVNRAVRLRDSLSIAIDEARLLTHAKEL